MSNVTHKIPHTCWIAEWSTLDDGGYEIFGSYHDDFLVRFDRVHEVDGFRCIQPIERVRNHWVIDTWIECSEGETSKITRLMTDKYFHRLVKNSVVHVDSVC